MSDNLEVGASSREIIKDKLRQNFDGKIVRKDLTCLLYTSPSPRDCS